jgi:SulP family sulfate permease
MDITGIQSLEEAMRGLRRRGVEVLLCSANPRVKAKLEKAGLLDLAGPGGYHDDLDSALQQAEWGSTLAQQPARTANEEPR